MFLLFRGTTKQIHQLVNDLNKFHPTLKFTMDHTTPHLEKETDNCECERKEAIPFLDTACSIDSGLIDTDLYRKPTDRNQYLLPESCHPKATSKAIPFSLALRIIRICRKPTNRDKRLKELGWLLRDRGYKENIIESAISKAKMVPRYRALLKRQKSEDTKRPVFVAKFDPRLPPLQAISAKHWRAMTVQDQYLAEVFPDPPLTAFKKQNNLKDILIRAKVPTEPKPYPHRKIKGMIKCGKDCSACPYIKEDKNIKYGKKQKADSKQKANM